MESLDTLLSLFKNSNLKVLLSCLLFTYFFIDFFSTDFDKVLYEFLYLDV